MTNAYLAAWAKPHEKDWEIEENLAELTELVSDAGLTVAGTIVQRRSQPEPGTLIGKGKIEEIKAMLSDDDIVVFDDELLPAQQANLVELLDAPVLDRTQVILDIFARRARTKEGKIQVELAQLNYTLPRLTGQGAAMSRLGGGIGTRGPGETKLEIDRRRIRERIADLRRELQDVVRFRRVQRRNRQRSELPMAALVGYTNAGKSTLLNALTGQEAYVQNQLFATLDPLIRRWDLNGQVSIYLGDTVGFIRKLPHTLVAAFRATLEDVLQADLLLHVIDASHPQADRQKAAVEGVLHEIGAEQDTICIYNKVDKLEHSLNLHPPHHAVSALTGEGLADLTQSVYKFFEHLYAQREYFFPFDSMSEAAYVRDHGEVLAEEFTPEGLVLLARVSPTTAGRLAAYERKTRK